ncbi:ATP-binding protein [Saccharopolyspora taberi]|uniref:LuxR family transcriptional regulator n=1 Tax=Saccharopolyspora taberi TaxID=60895 RepID=A0ABN3VAN3_9PSEU
MGRQGELATARRLLADCRVVTLTGTGGVGKTRLARHITTDLARGFRDGAAFVELAELRNPELLSTMVADKLGLHDQSDRPPIDAIVDHLRDSQFLLVLDNCEHLTAACASFVETLVASCPQLTVLTTSRQSLEMPGEHLLPVPPLSVPGEAEPASPAELDRYEAVRLFVDRATAVRPWFTVTEDNYRDVARLCTELEGLPLALELAAVRLRSLSVRQIADRLTHRLALLTRGNRFAPSRQQTLRALIDWSYELCSPAEKLVWARASVFSGGFDLEAAEHVCSGPGAEQGAIADIVHGLMSKSLLVAENHGDVMRYRMLETLREYGRDRLGADRTRVARLHRDWYAGLTARFGAEWIGPDQVAWTRRVTEDHANIRVALDFCAAEPGEAVVGLRMANQLDVYWTVRGFLAEARIWLDKMLGRAPRNTPEWVFAHRLLSWCALLQGYIEPGTAALEGVREVAELIGDEVSGAYVDVGWGLANLFTEREPLARDQFAAALEVFRRHGVQHGEGYAGFLHGLATAVSGDFETGRDLIRDHVTAGAAIGENFWRSWGLWALGMAELFLGDADAAEEAELAAFRLQQELGNRVAEAFTVHIIGGIAVRKGQFPRSATLFGIAARQWRALGANPWNFGMFTKRIVEYGAISYQELGEQGYKRHYDRGGAMSRDEAVRYVLGESAEPVAARKNPLTRRENEVAGLVAAGLTNREIAARLYIAQRTAETHVDRILTKLDFNTRAQIATWVVEGRRGAAADRS